MPETLPDSAATQHVTQRRQRNYSVGDLDDNTQTALPSTSRRVQFDTEVKHDNMNTSYPFVVQEANKRSQIISEADIESGISNFLASKFDGLNMTENNNSSIGSSDETQRSVDQVMRIYRHPTDSNNYDSQLPASIQNSSYRQAQTGNSSDDFSLEAGNRLPPVSVSETFIIPRSESNRSASADNVLKMDKKAIKSLRKLSKDKLAKVHVDKSLQAAQQQAATVTTALNNLTGAYSNQWTNHHSPVSSIPQTLNSAMRPATNPVFYRNTPTSAATSVPIPLSGAPISQMLPTTSAISTLSSFQFAQNPLRMLADTPKYVYNKLVGSTAKAATVATTNENSTVTTRAPVVLSLKIIGIAAIEEQIIPRALAIVGTLIACSRVALKL